MNFAFDADQEQYRSSLRRFFEQKGTLAQTRADMTAGDGFDRQHWLLLAEQLGVQGLLVPEKFGGSGQSFLEVAIVMYEAGRSLTSLPLFSSAVLTTSALLHSEDDAMMAKWLPRLAAGDVIGALAVVGPSGSWQLDAPEVTATRQGAGYVLDGVKSYVLHGQTADVVLVSALLDGQLTLFLVTGDAPGLARTPLEVLDPTRPQALLTLTGTPAELVGRPGQALAGLERTLQLGAVALAQEQMGAAQTCLDMAVAYAGVRQQFGRTIGSFQAIKHLCADVLIEIESGRAAADYAAWAAVHAPDELPVAASLAKAFCSDASYLAASQNIQIHGGIGFTWEHDAQLFFKRATSMSQYLGSPVWHRELLASHLL